MSEETKKNLFQKMSLIESELPTVAKNIALGKGKNAYRAVSERDVKRVVKDLEVTHGVKSLPVNAEILESREMEREGYEGKKRIDLFVRIKLTTRFINIEDPKDFVDVITYGDGIDPMDKAVGKAITYAFKYALMNAYKLGTGDDPDEYLSEQMQPVSTPVKRDDPDEYLSEQMQPVSTPVKRDDKHYAKKLYLEAINIFKGDAGRAERALKSYLKDTFNLNSLSELTFEHRNYDETEADFRWYLHQKQKQQHEAEGLKL